MKLAVVFLALLVCALALTQKEYQLSFTNWMQEYGKVYVHDEFAPRFNVFKQNLDFVNQHNSNPDKTFEVGLNQFADLSVSEFTSLYTGLKYDSLPMATLNTVEDVSQLPESFDWRSKGVVSGVKNQGQCGSCWSFSATGSMESICALGNLGLEGLSEQNLVDCSRAEGNMGCAGGLMDSAFRYVISNGGLDTELYYPYTAKDGTCHYNAAGKAKCHISGFHDVAAGSESALQAAVAKQPVSVAIDASHSSFQLYKSGTYFEPACSTTKLDHGVLAIGWGADYWLVKNSWGPTWGIAGYIQMSRNKANNCGIATMASYPSV